MAKTKRVTGKDIKEREKIAATVDNVVADLHSIRQIAHELVYGGAPHQEMANSAMGLEAIACRAGRALDEYGASLGNSKWSHWVDYLDAPKEADHG
jgi:hypothetical protein